MAPKMNQKERKIESYNTFYVYSIGKSLNNTVNTNLNLTDPFCPALTTHSIQGKRSQFHTFINLPKLRCKHIVLRPFREFSVIILLLLYYDNYYSTHCLVFQRKAQCEFHCWNMFCPSVLSPADKGHSDVLLIKW